MPENAMGGAPDQVAKGPEVAVETKPPEALEAQFATKSVERDPSVVAQEQEKIDSLKKSILASAQDGHAPTIQYVATEGGRDGEIAKDVDKTRLDAISIATNRKLADLRGDLKVSAPVLGLVGFAGGTFGGAVATGTTIGSAVALGIGAAAAAVPVGAALLGYGIYKFVKSRQMKTAESMFRGKWGKGI